MDLCIIRLFIFVLFVELLIVGCKDMSASAETGAVRLTGGSSPKAGRLEVFYNHQWGSVCDDGVTNNLSRVVCSQLGYHTSHPSVIRYLGYEYDTADMPIWLDSVECRGGERYISECDHDPWGLHDCTHDEDVGINCSTKKRGETTQAGRDQQSQEQFTPYQLREMTNVAYASSSSDDAVRGNVQLGDTRTAVSSNPPDHAQEHYATDLTEIPDLPSYEDAMSNKDRLGQKRLSSTKSVCWADQTTHSGAWWYSTSMNVASSASVATNSCRQSGISIGMYRIGTVSVAGRIDMNRISIGMYRIGTVSVAGRIDMNRISIGVFRIGTVSVAGRIDMNRISIGMYRIGTVSVAGCIDMNRISIGMYRIGTVSVAGRIDMNRISIGMYRIGTVSVAGRIDMNRISIGMYRIGTVSVAGRIDMNRITVLGCIG
ncbi:NETR-like protein [Mya arenaria]|uniref:NETR-like protein n=1 Tax=Mya arenaria TaxID=6604 RepID=A0ABY7E9N3_MYAAR|nr:NETR-like protein [Mya arenaria]